MAGDWYGYNAAIDGDYAIVTRATGFKEYNGTNNGAAFVFEEVGGNWVEAQKLIPSDIVGGEKFGISAALSGNYALIAAFFDDDLGTRSGSAYVFERIGNTWTEVQKLTASDPSIKDNFGLVTEIKGNCALISADKKNNQKGAVYVFERSSGIWTQVQKLTASDAETGEYFGGAFSLSKNCDTALINAWGDQDEAGAVYAFERIDGAWEEVQKFAASDTVEGDQFGYLVSVDGDLAVAGAGADDDLGADSGSFYVFKRIDGTWTEITKVTASDGATGDRFGEPVLSGHTTVVTAFKHDGAGLDSGAAYIYDLETTIPLTQTRALIDDLLTLSL